MDTSAIAATPAVASPATPTAARTSLGKDDFLKLLTAQLANQDPLQPVDNQAFVAQLAQFSSLEQMQGVASRLDALLAATGATNQLGTAALAGKDVTYRADGIDLTAGGPPPALRAELDAPAAVTMVITDASGRAVRTVAVGARDAGPVELAWDGKDADGRTLPPGHYTVAVTAVRADATTASVSTLAHGRVDAVAYDASGARLVVGASSIPLSAVLRIAQP